MSRGLHRRRTSLAAALGVLVLMVAPSAYGSSRRGQGAVDDPQADGVRRSGDPALTTELRDIARDAMAAYDLEALIVRVTKNGRDVYTAALGTSMTGVRANPRMHFRNGAFEFTYTGLIFARLVDEKKVRLTDKLARWMPDLPNADQVSIRNLLTMTSGYADYVYTDEILDGTQAEPFRQWTGDELIAIGTSRPIEFEPGTNFGYSHTNYVILGKVLEKILKKPLPAIMNEYVFRPMHLENTSSNDNTPAIPEPVLHAYSSERREFLKVPAGVPFYEESTYWNPSWTTAQGGVQTTDIYDMTRSMEVVGSGKLVSRRMRRAEVGKTLIDFGGKDPTGRCAACNRLTEEQNYGLGVVLLGSWITQTKNFAGSGGTSGYLPSRRYTVSVVTTYRPGAFDPTTGAYDNASSKIFTELATAVAPGDPPPAG